MVNSRVNTPLRTRYTPHKTKDTHHRVSTGSPLCSELEMDLLSMDSTEMKVEITHSGCILDTCNFVLPNGTHTSKVRSSAVMRFLLVKIMA